MFLYPEHSQVERILPKNKIYGHAQPNRATRQRFVDQVDQIVRLAPLNVFPGDDVGARNRLAKWLNRKEPLDYDGIARVTRRWQPYAGMVYFHMLLEGLSETGALKNDGG
jgi:hypothetical protein